MTTHHDEPAGIIGRPAALMRGVRLRRANHPAPAALVDRVQQYVDQYGTPAVSRKGNVALVRIDGPVMNDVGWLSEWGVCYTHAGVARAIDEAAAGGAHTVVLDLDCVGWGAWGSDETLAAIARARRTRRVVALVRDMAASGGYWMAAACQEIAAVRTAWVGSIGAIIMLEDTSALYQRLGVRPVPIAHPDGKAEARPGMPITDESVADLRRIVEHLGERFFADVAAARGLSVQAVRDLDAAIFGAQDALDRRLIDRVVVTADEAIAAWQSLPAPVAPSTTPAAHAAPGAPIMTTPTPPAPDPITALAALSDDQVLDARPSLEAAALARAAARPAAFAQLRAIFGDDAGGIVEAQAAHMTAAQAMATAIERLRAQTAQARAAAEASAKDAQAAHAEVARLKARGAEPVPAGPVTQSSSVAPEHPFFARARAMARERGITVFQAIQALRASDPQAHAEWAEHEREQFRRRKAAAK